MSPTFSTLRSIHSASAACMRARRARGIPAYAASRVSACLIACSRSSGKREPLRRRMKSRLLEQRGIRRRNRRSARAPGRFQNTRATSQRGLQRSLLACREQVDARREHSRGPSRAIEAAAGERRDLHRSSRCARTPLSTSDSISSSTKNGLPSERCTSRSRTCSGRSATEPRGDLVGERFELDRGHVPAPASPLELGPGGGDDQERARVADRPLEQLEQRRLGPVDVFHEQDERQARAAVLVQELDPGIPETVARRQRVQVAGDVAPERKAEDRPILEARRAAPEGSPGRASTSSPTRTKDTCRRGARGSPGEPRATPKARAGGGSCPRRPRRRRSRAAAPRRRPRARMRLEEHRARHGVRRTAARGRREGVLPRVPGRAAGRRGARSSPSRRRAAARRTRTHPWPPARSARPRRSGRVPPCSRRAHTFTASPVTNELCASASTTTSPVFTPIRSASDGSSSGRRSRIASAA